jgi:hypothetical protein
MRAHRCVILKWEKKLNRHGADRLAFEGIRTRARLLEMFDRCTI